MYFCLHVLLKKNIVDFKLNESTHVGCLFAVDVILYYRNIQYNDNTTNNPPENRKVAEDHWSELKVLRDTGTRASGICKQ